MTDLIGINWIATLVAAIVPMFIGFIWYHEKTFGNRWMKETGLDHAKLASGNMAIIFGSTFVLSFFLAFAMNFIVIHQWGIFGTLLSAPGLTAESEEYKTAQMLFQKYGTLYRSFKHGFLHGAISAITLALPILGINALFERKSWTYILIHLGFWIITLGIMGGIICGWM